MSEDLSVSPEFLAAWEKEHQIKKTVFEGGPEIIEVLTVWLQSRPGVLIYETVVSGGPLRGKTYRYKTLEEAQKGHDEMVSYVNLSLCTF